MSFEAYLASIKAQTGKTVDDFRTLAAPLGFAKQKDAIAWLKADHGLGHGHAMLVAKLLFEPDAFAVTDDERVATMFAGKKARWKPLYDRLLAEVSTFGADVGTDASNAYVSFVRNGKKFAIAQPSTADRFDLGLKLKGEPAAGRFEESGKWNPMVTHRVRIADDAEADAEVSAWLKRAYEAVK